MADSYYVVLGAGGSGKRAYKIFCSLVGADHVRILNTSPAEASVPDGDIPREAFLSGLDEVLALRPRGVFVAVPTSLHIAYARDFLGVAEFIILDKPLDADLLTCECFVRNCRRSTTRVFVNYQRRYLNVWRSLKDSIDPERDGILRHGSVTVRSYYPSWRLHKPPQALYAARKELGGGVLLTECHEPDLLGWLLGEIKCVTCVTESAEADSVENYAQLLLIVKNAGRECPITVTLDDLCPEEQRTATLCFEKAIYQIDEIRGTVQRISEDGTQVLCDEAPDMMDAHRALICDVMAGGRSAPTAEDGLTVNAVIHAARESARLQCARAVTRSVCPTEGVPYLDRAIERLQDVFGDRLLAVYGMGSLGYGGYVDGWSDFDIDVLVTCDREEAREVYRVGKEIESEIISSGFPRIDIRVYNPVHLNERATILTYGQCSRACMLCDSAILLAGKELRESILHPTLCECNNEAIGLLEWMLNFPESRWETLPWDDIAAHFALVCRFHYTADHGSVAGKKVALEYFLDTYADTVDSTTLRWILWALALRSRHESRQIRDSLHEEAVNCLRNAFAMTLRFLKQRQEDARDQTP